MACWPIAPVVAAPFTAQKNPLAFCARCIDLLFGQSMSEMTHAIGALPFCRRAPFFLQVVATGSVSLAMVSVSEGELNRHLIAMLSASEPSTMDDVSGLMYEK